jgi:hypothetical protein
MHARTHARTIFASVGVSISLVAAIATVFALAGGLLAFHAWPIARPEAPEASLEVAAPLREPAVVLPARRAAAPRAASRRVVALTRVPVRPAGRVTTRGTGPRVAAAPSPTRPATGSRPAPASPPPRVTPPHVPSLGPVVAPVVTPAASAVAGTAAGASSTLAGVGTAVPVLAPVTTLAGGAVAGAGTAVGGLLNRLAGAR